MKKIEADVVVIAGGMSGLSAAIAAAEKDAGVIVFEKGETTGGAGNMGMGLFAVGSHVQKENMIDLTPDEAFGYFMEYTHWKGDARLIRKYYDLSGSTIEWLEHMGVEFLGAFKFFNQSFPTWHIIKVPGGGNLPSQRCASVMVKAMTDYANELGVEFHFGTPAKKILTENGRVTGVLAVDPNGEEILAECDAVVIATGGFGDNPEMFKEFTDHTWGEDLFSFRIPGLVGDGMKMAWEAGAARSAISIEMTYNAPGISNFFRTLNEVMRQPNLLVNYQGKRIFNEQYMNNTVYTGNALDRQFRRTGFTVIDDSILEHYRKNGLDYVSWNQRLGNIDNWERELEQFFSGEAAVTATSSLIQLDKAQTDSLFVADSLEELAEKAGIDAANLVKTVEEYNAACVNGDRFFNKDPRFMRPLLGPRFYACKQCPAGYGSLGGILVDDDLKVQRADGTAIKGLYACGTDAACLFGDSYCFYMPGSTMGWAVNTGRMAGDNAIDYLDSEEYG